MEMGARVFAGNRLHTLLPTPLRYGLAIAVTAFAFALRLVLLPVESRLAFLTFYPATVICFLVCGIGPGVVATGLSAVVGFYVFTPPYWQFSHHPEGEIAVAVFVFSNVLIGWMQGRLDRYDVTLKAARTAERRAQKGIDQLTVTTPAMFHSIDTAGRLVSVSDLWLRKLGYQRPEVLGRPSTEFLTPESAERAQKEVLPEFFRTGFVENIEYQMVTKTGQLLDVLMSANLIRDAQGRAERSLAMIVDITARKEADRKLVASQQQLQLVADNIPGLISILDRELRFVFVNRAYADWFKVEPDRLLGVSVQAFHGDGFFSAIAGSLDVALRGATVAEEWDVLANGVLRHCHVAIIPQRNERREVVGLFKILTDISEIKRGEEALRKSEERFRAVVEAAPNALLIVDAKRRISLVNRRAEALFGYPRSELIDRSIEELVPNRFRDKHASYVQTFLTDPQARSMGPGRELFARRADGTEVSVEIGLSPIETPDGSFTLASIIDISERKRSQAAHDRLAAIVEHSEDAIISKTPEGIVTSWNRGAETLFGYSAQEAIGKSVTMLVPEHFLEEDLRVREQVRREGRAIYFETLRRRKDGTEFDASVRISPILNAAGEYVGDSNIARDITERMRVQRNLKRANENLQEFSRVASHDLKSPLRGISELVGWIREDLGDSGKITVMRNLERIADRVKRMERLISDLLRYARSEQVDADCSLIDFTALLADILRVDPVAEGFNVDIRVAAQPIWAPRIPIETVLRNLIANAVKHHDRSSGQITLEVGSDGGFSCVSVTDDGPGIPVPAQQRVFLLFQTASAPERAGSGLGLALVKRLLEVHGGRIELVSPLSDGRGSRFCFWWPNTPRRARHD
jgi:PAS domain S-box-containing protein